MSCRDNSATNSCIEQTFSTCIDHEAALGTNTKITSSCVTQSAVNTDLYAITDEIIANSSTEGLSSNCLTYPMTSGAITLRSAIETHGTELCSLRTRVTTLENRTLESFNISSLNLNLRCLVNPCGGSITTLGPLLQALIDRSCPQT